ncbi:MAG: hypothetical protein E7001_01810 [Coriobacteriaceae bacterium]|nr:hypothetical protein [Coriobacteriaceae bacterium]
MNRLLRFEFSRAKRGNLLFALLAIFTLFVGTTFFFAPSLMQAYRLEQGDAAIISVFNSFAQFSVISLGSVYSYAFSRDFQNGSYDFYPQIGVSPVRAMISRATVLLICSWVGVLVVFAVVIIANDSSNIHANVYAVSYSLLAVAFVLALSCAVSVFLRNPMFSVLALFILFVIGSSINYNFYGLTFQTDTSSFSTFMMGYLLGYDGISPQIASLSLDFSLHGPFIALSLSLIWLLIAVGTAALGVRRLAKNNRYWGSPSTQGR